MNIAFFDFDGTITKQDSLFLFVCFAVGRKRLYLGLLSKFWVLLGYMCGLYSNTYAKQELMRYFFGGLKQSDFLALCEAFLPTLESILKSSAIKRIQWHKNRGDEVVVVSASFEAYLLPLCKKLGVACIGTKLESKNGILSGNIAGENCYGSQKAIRIKAKYNLAQYTKIYAYGDTKGDTQMLLLATSDEYRFYRFFH
ncbi:HAD family hydrolase [Helicobacter fennelliae]|uniref:Phosphoserine phosphatase n=1 Tax=Helicobacter fennelliae MRY12-0050 TaxID=1325130 RepID=T1D3G2_9HELI|nr:HAD family hydrolase [Helicobacter fennelliae]GAD19751.1 phosphoserine phosphatase [Helicobacter fennelliae MRY12-0050]STP07214.1 HAD hydrolase, family IB [Helicobacter fennelliae]STQ85203.1 HAD hydrolase, family IB [Helicobacter fennelliae]